VLVIDFYKYGGSEKNRGGSEKNCLSCVLPGVYSSSLSMSVSNSNSVYGCIMYKCIKDITEEVPENNCPPNNTLIFMRASFCVTTTV